MRRLLLVLLTVALACGGESTAPATGSVKFTRDANTCNGAPLAFDFFSDGTLLGSATLASGGSQSYAVSVGSHIFSVRVSNSTATFAPVTGAVAANTTFTYLMRC